MLAGVEHQQELTLVERVEQDLARGSLPAFADAERGGHRLRQEVRHGERRQIDEPHAIGEVVHEAGGHPHGQSSLADASGSGERDEAGRGEDAAGAPAAPSGARRSWSPRLADCDARGA